MLSSPGRQLQLVKEKEHFLYQRTIFSTLKIMIQHKNLIMNMCQVVTGKPCLKYLFRMGYPPVVTSLKYHSTGKTSFSKKYKKGKLKLPQSLETESIKACPKIIHTTFEKDRLKNKTKSKHFHKK